MCFRPTTATKKMKRCPSCGTIYPPAIKKCNKCNIDLPDEDSTPKTGKDSAPQTDSASSEKTAPENPSERPSENSPENLKA